MGVEDNMRLGENNAQGEIFKISSQEESQQRMEWKTIEDVNDMDAGINDEDNRNKCDKVHRKKKWEASTMIRMLCMYKKIFFTIKISNDMALLL